MHYNQAKVIGLVLICVILCAQARESEKERLESKIPVVDGSRVKGAAEAVEVAEKAYISKTGTGVQAFNSRADFIHISYDIKGFNEDNRVLWEIRIQSAETDALLAIIWVHPYSGNYRYVFGSEAVMKKSEEHRTPQEITAEADKLIRMQESIAISCNDILLESDVSQPNKLRAAKILGLTKEVYWGIMRLFDKVEIICGSIEQDEAIDPDRCPFIVAFKNHGNNAIPALVDRFMRTDESTDKRAIFEAIISMDHYYIRSYLLGIQSTASNMEEYEAAKALLLNIEQEILQDSNQDDKDSAR